MTDENPMDGIHFAYHVDWRKEPQEVDPDDELLPETPPEVVRILGFDPLEWDDD